MTIFSPFLLLLIFRQKEVREYQLSIREQQLVIVISLIVAITMTFLQINLHSILFSNLLILCSLIDIKYREIPDVATLIGLIIVLAYYIAPYQTPSLFQISITLAVYSIFFVSTYLGYMGGGDNKILLPIPLLLMPDLMGLLVFIFLLSMSSIVWSIPQIIHNRTLKLSIPLAPAITMAFAGTVILLQYFKK